MTADQRTELLKRLENAGVEKIPLEKCTHIARELNLTVEQVSPLLKNFKSYYIDACDFVVYSHTF
jgi:hypothetical protein